MGRSERVNKKRKFHGNRYTKIVNKDKRIVNNNVSELLSSPHVSHDENKEIGPSSASKRKLFSSEINKDADVHSVNSEDSECVNSGNNVIIDVKLLSDFISEHTICKYCQESDCMTIVEDVTVRKGLASKLIIKCNSCKFENSMRSSKQTENKYYDINIRLVYGMRCIGKGYSGAKALCGMLDLPPPPAKFNNYSNIIENKLKVICEESMKKAAAEAVEENDGSTDVAIALDGTWQKRGHASLHGVVSATLVDTGKVVDVEVLSKFCQNCQTDEEHECSKNYSGASGGMEAVGAVNIFARSVSERSLQYVKYLGDGDSKGFMRVNDSKPYGDSVLIEKLECIGHIQKRLGCRLRRFKRDMKGKKLSDNKGVGGAGRLTDAEIDRLQKYYGLAIRRNAGEKGDVKSMQQAVWATYFHKCSTDQKPIHNFCPKGPESWCRFQRAAATGSTYTHKNALPLTIMEAIKPIYKDLSMPSLLKKCIHGKTQNTNESLNNCIWERIPKNVFVGAQTLRIGVFDAVLTFNEGVMARKKVLDGLGIGVGSNCINALRGIDNLRLFYANRAAESMTKEARTERRQQKKRKEAEDDGQEDYCPGMY